MTFPTAEELTQKLAELAAQMSDPEVGRDVPTIKRLSREHADTEQLLTLVTERERVQRELAEAAELAAQDDAELAELAVADQESLTTRLAAAEEEITSLLVPRDPRDSRDVIIEMRAGAGGEEAALFVAELFRAYSRYAEQNGWSVHVVSQSLSEQGGYKEVVAEITGDGAFGTLKFERGVHRVQRVPETEKMGRIHTSTITVAVMPQAEEVDIEVKPEDIRIDTYRASGAGGQHVNKTSSAIRLTHVPTGTVVAVQDERSQHKNKEKAFRVLRARLLEAQEERQRAAVAADRRLQVGTGDRSEKIRTYNFPQDRITDHRIKQSWGNLPRVFEGDLGAIFSDLAAAELEARVQQLGSKK